MGILNDFGIQNQLTNFIGDHRSALTNFGVGLANGSNLSQGIGLGTQGLATGAVQDTAYATSKKAEAERLDGINKTAAWLRDNYPQFSALPPDEGFKLAAQLASQKAGASGSDPSDVATYKFYAQQETDAGRTPKSFADYQAGTRPGIKGSLSQPIPFVDDKGGLHPIQEFTDGSRIDLNTGLPPDPSLKYSPYDLAAAKSGGGADATTAAAARTSLPGVEQAYAITKKAIADLTTDPSVKAGQSENFGNVLGVPQQMLPIIPKTNRANFQNVIDQLSGQAFLNIRQALKGAGQVTDFEGAKGEEAISRMKSAAARGDETAFNNAVKDFNDALDNGIALLRKQAQGDFAAGNVPGLPPEAAQGGGSTGDPELDKALQQYGGQ